MPATCGMEKFRISIWNCRELVRGPGKKPRTPKAGVRATPSAKGASVVRREALELSHGEDGTFLADVERSDVAAAALPYPAFHAVL